MPVPAPIGPLLTALALGLEAAPAPAGPAAPRDDAAEVGAVTYGRDVAPILRAKCVPCHREGQVGPFPLATFAEASRKRAGLAESVEAGRMPPWHADPQFGRFRNDRSLTPRERSVLLAWVEQGAPEGNPADASPPPADPTGWQLGTPDTVFAVSKPFTVKAEGTVKYQYFLVPTRFTEDRWIQAVELRPTSRAVVHHIIVFAIPPGGGLPPGNGSLGGHLASYAPGDEAQIYPEGMAKKVVANATLVFQVHYTPIGKEVVDRPEIALKFAAAPVQREVKTVGVRANPKSLRIAAGQADFESRSTYTFRDDAILLSLAPHMHLRGRSFRYEATYPDGRTETLLSVPAYDFNWQTTYKLAEPARMPRGTRIDCVAHFDNSAANPALTAEDVARNVRWGEQTADEMMIGYLDCVPERPLAAAAADAADDDDEGDDDAPAGPGAAKP